MTNDPQGAYAAVMAMPEALGWHGSDVRITALQSGFVAQAFLLEVGAQQAFVKCYDRERAITARMLRSNEFALPVSAWMVAHTPVRGRMTAPFATRTGSFTVDMGRFVCVAFDYWQGIMPCEHGLSAPQVEHLATTIAWLHRSTAQVPLPAHVEREDFKARWDAPFTAYLGAGWAQLDFDLQQVVAPYRVALQQMHARFRTVAAQLQHQVVPMVVCHTDIHCMNMLVAGDQSVLLDIEGLKLAPPEHDFMFVCDEPYWPQWYAAYQRVCGDTPVDAQRLRFYQERRVLEDIYEWVEQVVSEHPEGADRQDIFTGMTRLLRFVFPHKTTDHASQ